MIKYIIFFFVSLVSFPDVIKAIRWNASGFGDNPGTVISLKLTMDSPKIDVYTGEQIIILRDIENYGSPIKIFCFIAGYNDQSEIKYRFCKDTNCLVDIADDKGATLFVVYNMDVRAETKFLSKKGMKVELDIKKDSAGRYPDISGDYYCEARDYKRNFIIRSNNIQIRDYVFWEQNLVHNTNNLKTRYEWLVQRNSTPLKFPCLDGPLTMNNVKPLWASQDFVSPVSWSICSVMKNYDSLRANERVSFTHCRTHTLIRWDGDKTLEPVELSKMTEWNWYVNDKGDLLIFSLTPQSAPGSFTYALMCYTKKNNEVIPINTYISNYDGDVIKDGVVFDATMANYRKPLAAISPKVQNRTIYARKKPIGGKVPVVSIYAKYNASSSAKAFWTHNGNTISNGDMSNVDNYKVNFISDIRSDMAGVYVLTVSDGPDMIIFTINVVVLGPPSLVDMECLPLVKHVLEFEMAVFSCTYRDFPKELKLSINNQEIPLNQDLQASRTSLQNSYPYLSLLNFTISSNVDVQSGIFTMTYKVFNLTKTLGQTMYQDHSFMFFVKNDYGLSVKSTSIYTVPILKPLISKAPEAMNCTSVCSSLVKHEFQCTIDTSQFLNKELIIDHYWSINGHRLEQIENIENPFASYCRVDPVTKDLTILPIVSNNTDRDKFVKEALKSNYIKCHLDLVSALESKSRFQYKSDLDKSLGNMLSAKITMDYEPINMAYVYWIVAVILALLILIILIVLLTRWCMTNKGETYKLDKIEREHGYDPEKEVQEEMFKPYEREEHDPDVVSASTGERKLSMTGHSVGSADDGELDNYDLDPSNFNEDGSIIGKYGANPRNRAPMT